MSILNCLDIAQQIAKCILQKRYKHKVDMNFNLECNLIRKRWNSNGENNLAIQFYLKKQLKPYLVEEWNILCNLQQINENSQQFFEKCIELTQLTPLQQKQDNEIDHIIHLNENKSTDWIDPNLIATLQIQLSNKMTVNVAYLQNFDPIEQMEKESVNEFKSFRRDRFLSDDIHTQNETQIRKTSFHDLDGLRKYKKNQAIITQAIHRKNDSLSSNSSKNKSTQLLTIINKKDDVEILSSAEDAQKIIDQDENGDYEIQMIIDEQPMDKGQTVIIKSISQMHPVTDLILKIREKKHHYSQQLNETLSFIKSYT
ncbi:unnamed protein product [Paramecium pentaurelia]|uniref:Uncharacterized protein n=1 Tax=Paramecium pentaurelia TaxID=43138 RepID=A0A8S1WR93_9CILI|nr:unnamed protein product [Paramecium pentaurelia]